jgi:hypothetical protein
MPAKMARSAPRPPFGLPERPVSVGTSRRSCGKAVKPRIFTPVQKSPGESRLNMIELWRNVQKPKLDLTSFGHWSGTGLIDWNASNPISN